MIRRTSKSSVKEVGHKNRFRSLGPVLNLEEHVPSDWWRYIFNSTYLKTDADVVEDPNITKNEVDLFLKILKLTPEGKILDLCCGQGRHSLELARRGFQNIEGLDRSHYLIQKAKAQARIEGLSIRFRERCEKASISTRYIRCSITGRK